jgi:hypothetical protein
MYELAGCPSVITRNWSANSKGERRTMHYNVGNKVKITMRRYNVHIMLVQPGSGRRHTAL